MYKVQGLIHVLVHGDETDSESRSHLLGDVILDQGHADGAVIQISCHQAGKLCSGVLCGIELADEAYEQLEEVDLILSESACIESQSGISDTVDIGLGPDAADSVGSGLVLDVVDSGFLGEGVDVDDLDLADQGCRVHVFLSRIVGCLDDGGNLFSCHGSLDCGKSLGKSCIFLFLEAGDSLCCSKGRKVVTYDVLLDDILEGAVVIPLGEVSYAVDEVHIAVEKVRSCPVIEEVGHDIGSDARAFSGEQQAELEVGDDGVNDIRIEAFLRNLCHRGIDD